MWMDCGKCFYVSVSQVYVTLYELFQNSYVFSYKSNDEATYSEEKKWTTRVQMLRWRKILKWVESFCWSNWVCRGVDDTIWQRVQIQSRFDAAELFHNFFIVCKGLTHESSEYIYIYICICICITYWFYVKNHVHVFLCIYL